MGGLTVLIILYAVPPVIPIRYTIHYVSLSIFNGISISVILFSIDEGYYYLL